MIAKSSLRYVSWAAIVLVASALAACGDSNTGPDPLPPPLPPPPTPSAAVQIEGDGDIVLHPSAVATHTVAVVFPLRFTETGGGTATWNFLRASYFLNGQEIERSEQGANVIRAAGYSDIAANSTTEVDVVTRLNTDNFDRVELLAGFSDKKDGRVFDVAIPFASFDSVVFNPIPTALPEGFNPR